ncbi:MAG: hypothetical protein M0002_03790 [Rhodospirillales bacterium]|nr:hypothetical protein [Rhodospirillales bacterium]
MNLSPAAIPPIEDDEAERLALEAAVAKARADVRSGVPHEKVRAEMPREVERLSRKIAAPAKR